MSFFSNNPARCPRCGSTSIYVGTKGYRPGKGCCGYIIFGPLGLLCGLFGANRLRKTCVNCNHVWH